MRVETQVVQVNVIDGVTQEVAATLLPWLPMLLAFFLYLSQLGTAPLWYDEASTAWMAELPIGRMVEATAADTHPPLYYLIETGVQRMFGSNALAMRFPSLLFALGAMFVACEIARSLKLSPLAQLIGMGLMLISPFQLHFAQEARMYSLLELEVLLMLLAALNRRWLGFALAATAALYTHNYALIYLPVIAFIGLIREGQAPAGGPEPFSLVDWAIACVTPLVLWLPWAAVLIKQMSDVAAGYWIQPVTPGNVVYVFYTWLFGFTLPDWAQPTGVMVAVGLLAWLSIKAWRSEEYAPFFLLGAVLAPVAIVTVVSLSWKPILLFRGFAPGVPLLFLLAGWGVAQVSTPRRLYALGILVPLLCTAIVGHYIWNPDHKTGINQFAEPVRALWQDGDVIFHANEGSLIELHSGTGDLPQYLIPRCPQPNIGGLSTATRLALGMQQANPDTLTWRRAWFVWSWPPTVTQCEVDEAEAFLRKYRHELIFPVRDDGYVTANVWLLER